jgi:hypothetical protein
MGTTVPGLLLTQYSPFSLNCKVFSPQKTFHKTTEVIFVIVMITRFENNWNLSPFSLSVQTGTHRSTNDVSIVDKTKEEIDRFHCRECGHSFRNPNPPLPPAEEVWK